jgi:single-strand DNA-binding protein
MRRYRLPAINKISIVGNLTKDPDLNTTTKNVPVANFRIASSRKFRSASGERKEEVCFVNVTAWLKLAEACKAKLTKGDSIFIEGRLQSKSWKDQKGEQKNSIEILAERIQFLSQEIEEESAEVTGEDIVEEKEEKVEPSGEKN